MSDLWTEASYDAEAEAQALNLETAKHASSGLWSFLAQAQSPEEYADRAALAADSIAATAATYNVPFDSLMDACDHRFALLMEARDNPFADDSQDGSGDDSSDSKDDDSDSDDDKDDSKDDNGDGHDDDSDSDEDSDDTGDGDDEDDDSDDNSSDDEDSGTDNNQADNSTPPWTTRMSALATRINSGENPLQWSDAAPFARSSARTHAADGANPVTDTNTPQDTEPAAPAPAPVPGMEGGIAETTKPRQLPAGDGTGPGMGMDGITSEFDPDLNGGDIEQGADANLPGEPEDDNPFGKSAMLDKIDSIAVEVKKYNPTLPNDQCHKIANQVYEQYLSKHAEDVNPLLYGDRAAVGDGPISGPLKNWSPADMKPPKLPGSPKLPGAPGETPDTGTPTKPGAPGAAAAEEGAAADLLPLLAL